MAVGWYKDLMYFWIHNFSKHRKVFWLLGLVLLGKKGKQCLNFVRLDEPIKNLSVLWNRETTSYDYVSKTLTVFHCPGLGSQISTIGLTVVPWLQDLQLSNSRKTGPEKAEQRILLELTSFVPRIFLCLIKTMWPFTSIIKKGANGFPTKHRRLRFR